MRLRINRPSPAMVVACLALFVGLGGTSISAVANVPDNSVGTDKIKNNAVTSPKIAGNAVTAAKLSTKARSTIYSVPDGASKFGMADCVRAGTRGGERLLGGGAFWSGNLSNAQASQMHIVASGPLLNSWRAGAYNNSGSQQKLVVWVMCIRE